MFARAWLLYQSEQALYCVAEKRPSHVCRINLSNSIIRFLPWGSLSVQQLAESPNGGTLQISWGIKNYVIPIRRSLDLSWSMRSRSFRSF
jgi:hypothetical protein